MALFLLLLTACLFPPTRRTAAAENIPASPLRLGFSVRLFVGLNESDALAAVRGFGRTIAREQQVPVVPEPTIFRDAAEIAAALRADRVDVVGLQTSEFAAHADTTRFSPILTTFNGGTSRERYVLLVPTDSPFRGLHDLRGKRLLHGDSARMSLGLPWLDVLLVQSGLAPTATHFGAREATLKTSRSVLGVFFGQADAGLALRTAFEAMAELNPQLRTRLRVLAESEEFVPLVLAVRETYQPPFRDRLIKGLSDMHATLAGQQTLTIFHSERLLPEPGSCLTPSFNLLKRHAELVSALPEAGKR